MSITHNANVNPIINKVLYGFDDIVDQLVKEAIINMAGATDEMMGEYPELYQDKQSIEAGFNHLREQATDLIKDMLGGLEVSLTKRLADIQFKAQVRNIEYDDDGNVTDSIVNIKFE